MNASAEPATTQPSSQESTPDRGGITPPQSRPPIHYRKGYERGFTMISNTIFLRTDISAGAKLLYCVLESYRFKQTSFYMSFEILQALTSAKTTSLRKWRRELEQAKLYGTSGQGGRRKGKTYHHLGAEPRNGPPGAGFEPGNRPRGAGCESEKPSARRRVSHHNPTITVREPERNKVVEEETKKEKEKKEGATPPRTPSRTSDASLTPSSSKAGTQPPAASFIPAGTPIPANLSADRPISADNNIPADNIPPLSRVARPRVTPFRAREAPAKAVPALGDHLRRIFNGEELPEADGLPGPRTMFRAAKQNLGLLNQIERAWVEGQVRYREGDQPGRKRIDWSEKETTMLKNIYVQRLLGTQAPPPPAPATPATPVAVTPATPDPGGDASWAWDAPAPVDRWHDPSGGRDPFFVRSGPRHPHQQPGAQVSHPRADDREST
jgi:hypothetical protein